VDDEGGGAVGEADDDAGVDDAAPGLLEQADQLDDADDAEEEAPRDDQALAGGVEQARAEEGGEQDEERVAVLAEPEGAGDDAGDVALLEAAVALDVAVEERPSRRRAPTAGRSCRASAAARGPSG
jgi:hypothetical protein